jgi:WXG100 family type VII secretion target
MDDMIVYRHGEIEALAHDIGGRAAKLSAAVDEMSRQVKSLTADFDGSGDAAFKKVQGDFEVAHGEMHRVLKSIEAAVGDSNQNARLTDLKNAARFEH